MAAAGSSGAGDSGVRLTLVIYCLVLKFLDTGPKPVNSGPYLNEYFSHEQSKISLKHFGYGSFALLPTFPYPSWHAASKRHWNINVRPASKRPNSDAAIIAICLMMSGDIHQCPGPFFTWETSNEHGGLQRRHLPENNDGSTAVIPQTVVDVTRLTVADGRGDGSGHSAGGWLPGVEAGYPGRGPMEAAAGPAVSLRLGSGLGTEVANGEAGDPGSDPGQAVTETTRHLEDSLTTGMWRLE